MQAEPQRKELTDAILIALSDPTGILQILRECREATRLDRYWKARLERDREMVEAMAAMTATLEASRQQKRAEERKREELNAQFDQLREVNAIALSEAEERYSKRMADIAKGGKS
jgi:hypothetical protein